MQLECNYLQRLSVDSMPNYGSDILRAASIVIFSNYSICFMEGVSQCIQGERQNTIHQGKGLMPWTSTCHNQHSKYGLCFPVDLPLLGVLWKWLQGGISGPSVLRKSTGEASGSFSMDGWTMRKCKMCGNSWVEWPECTSTEPQLSSEGETMSFCLHVVRVCYEISTNGSGIMYKMISWPWSFTTWGFLHITWSSFLTANLFVIHNTLLSETWIDRLSPRPILKLCM